MTTNFFLAEIAVVCIAEVGEAAVGENHPGEGLFEALDTSREGWRLGEESGQRDTGDGAHDVAMIAGGVLSRWTPSGAELEVDDSLKTAGGLDSELGDGDEV